MCLGEECQVYRASCSSQYFRACLSVRPLPTWTTDRVLGPRTMAEIHCVTSCIIAYRYPWPLISVRRTLCLSSALRHAALGNGGMRITTDGSSTSFRPLRRG